MSGPWKSLPFLLLSMALPSVAGAQVPMPAAPSIIPAVEPKHSVDVPAAPPTSPAGELYALMGNNRYMEWESTLLFPAEEHGRLMHILDVAGAGKSQEAMAEAGITPQQDPIDAITNAVAPEKPQKVVYPPEVPIFYLSSIIYHSEDDWVLWLNGQRFTAHRPVAAEKGVEVVGVTPESATFSWAPIQFEKVQGLLAPALDAKTSDAHGAAGAHSVLTGHTRIDEPARRVIFTLIPSQSFYTLVPTLSEGLPFRNKEGAGVLPRTMNLGTTSPAGTPFKVIKGTAVAATAGTTNTPGTPLVPGGAAPNVMLEATPLPKDPGYNDIQSMIDRSDKIKAQNQKK